MPKSNNFDLIRLAAALQVAVSHAVFYFKVAGHHWPVHVITDLFPGVPIFFFISGFLISHSFERNAALREFARNRFLRIYPALAVCFVLSVASVWATGYFDTTSTRPSEWLKWIVAQLSIDQFYNPPFMRQYGTGSLNASTWTITVEMQFYLLLPLVYAALGLRRQSRARSNAILLCLAVAFMAVNLAWVHFWDRSKPFFGLITLTFAPWFYMFLVGVVFQRNFELLARLIAGRFIPLVAGYVVVATIAARVLHIPINNSLNPVLFIALSIVTFAAAFSGGTLSDRLLRRNDLSYGVYLYHLPVINVLLVTGVAGGGLGVLATMAATLVLAYASWRLIEKPALGFKRHPVYAHMVAEPAGFVA